MAERMTGLSVAKLFDGNHNHPDIPRFLEQFGSLLHSDGNKATALKQIGVDTDFPLRVLVGVPKKDMTREQRLLAEGFCGLILGRNLGDTADLWTARPDWRPTNPGRVAAPLTESTLDVEWMLSLGVPRIVWERAVLMSDGALHKPSIETLGKRPGALMRYLLWLSIFGFSDPYQFFTVQRDA